ncbi:MAG: ParB/RepB/Spo0J family partition protein [Candidatus Bathyarchaeota archaeon]|nr:ParB/RepB/Spo0J family partition protein [Candidatus Bathyarchaeum sp.]
MEMANPEEIYMGNFNPRQNLESEDLGLNVQARVNAGKRGIVIPILVKPYTGKLEGFKYEVIDGKRRLQASLLNRLNEIPINIETEETDPTELMIMSYEANKNRKDFDWQEEAMFFTELTEVGYTQANIGKRFGYSQNRISEFITVFKKAPKVSAADIAFETIKEIVNKCPEQDLDVLFTFVKENKTSRDDIRKVLFALRNFYAKLFIINEFDKKLKESLETKYHKYRFNPKALKLFNTESDLRMGELDLKKKILTVDEYPTEESARQYAKDFHGEFIRPVEFKGWEVGVLATNIPEIDEKLEKEKPFVSANDVIGKQIR